MNYRPYVPDDDDVFITIWAKCGTTLLQQMFRQIRTAAKGGDMEFDDISRVAAITSRTGSAGTPGATRPTRCC